MDAKTRRLLEAAKKILPEVHALYEQARHGILYQQPVDKNIVTRKAEELKQALAEFESASATPHPESSGGYMFVDRNEAFQRNIDTIRRIGDESPKAFGLTIEQIDYLKRYYERSTGKRVSDISTGSSGGRDAGS